MKWNFLLLLALTAMIPALSHARVIRKNPAQANPHAQMGQAELEKNIIQYPGSSPISVQAKQVFLMDYNTGTTLLARAADEQMTPSSMTKMMTSYLIEEMIQQKKLSMESEFPVGEAAWRIQGSKTFVQLGSMMKVKDILSGIIIQSGNDACSVAATGIAGGEKQFAALMNAKAKTLGLSNTYFKNSHGLFEEGHYSTARDMAKLGAAIIKDHPEYYSIYREKDFTYNNIKQGNRNPLLYDTPSGKASCDGIKTGHTDEGGYGAVLSCVDGAQRYVLTLNGLPSMQARADEARRLMAWARENFEYRVYLTKGEVLEPAFKIKYGIKPTVRLAVKDTLSTLALRSDQNELSKKMLPHDSVIAPIKEGDILGKVQLTINGKVMEAELISLDASEKMGLFKQALSYIKSRLGFLGLDA